MLNPPWEILLIRSILNSTKCPPLDPLGPSNNVRSPVVSISAARDQHLHAGPRYILVLIINHCSNLGTQAPDKRRLQFFQLSLEYTGGELVGHYETTRTVKLSP